MGNVQTRLAAIAANISTRRPRIRYYTSSQARDTESVQPSPPPSSRSSSSTPSPPSLPSSTPPLSTSPADDDVQQPDDVRCDCALIPLTRGGMRFTLSLIPRQQLCGEQARHQKSPRGAVHSHQDIEAGHSEQVCDKVEEEMTRVREYVETYAEGLEDYSPLAPGENFLVEEDAVPTETRETVVRNEVVQAPIFREVPWECNNDDNWEEGSWADGDWNAQIRQYDQILAAQVMKQEANERTIEETGTKVLEKERGDKREKKRGSTSVEKKEEEKQDVVKPFGKRCWDGIKKIVRPNENGNL